MEIVIMPFGAYQELDYSCRLQAAGRFDRETVDNRQFRISGDGIGSHYDQHVIRRRYVGRHVRTIHQGAFPFSAVRPILCHLRVLQARGILPKLPNINATISQLVKH